MSEKPEKAEKNYSWKGSPNAGRVLAILAAIGAVVILLAGFFD
ncbi:MAG: hypothetical protein Q6K80_07460 [Thermostichus sp. DG_1_6_bins_120]